MKKYEINRIDSTAETRLPFWKPWGLGKWILKSMLFALLLLMFLLLFAIPRCGGPQDSRPLVLGPDSTYVTPEGDTLIGKNPRLFNPENPRSSNPSNPGGSQETVPSRPGDAPGTVPSYPGPGHPVDWPGQIGDGPGRDPGLPAPGDNKIPPTDPGDIVPDPETGRQVDASHLIVVLNSDEGDQTFNRFSEELSGLYAASECCIVYYNTLTKIIILQVESSIRDNVRQTLPSQIGDIDFYVCDIEVLSSGAYCPDDPAFRYYDYSWQYEPIQAYDAWEVTRGSKKVKIAVVDSYFELSHYDFRGLDIADPVSIENGTTDVYPPFYAEDGARIHGTHVAGIIFAQMNNMEGSCGIAPDCTFIPVSLGQSMNTATLVEGILYAVYKGADVINASIGLTIPDEIARRMPIPVQAEFARTGNIDMEHLWDYVFKLCDDRNTTIVWSEGNNNILSAMDESKRNSSTVKVAALDRNLRKAYFSNFGNLPEYGFTNSTVSAPGCGIMSTIPYCDYYALDGTSMAAPIVTGAVALMKSICGSLSNEDVIDILKTTAKPLRDRSIGGLLQIRDALDMIKDEFMRFDDIMHDHSRILGRWESTELLDVQINGTLTGEKARIILTFTEEASGTVEIVYNNGDHAGEICRAPITAKYGQDNIVLDELHAPKSEQGSSFMKATFTCTPDSQGLMKVEYRHKDNSVTNFYLRKIE